MTLNSFVSSLLDTNMFFRAIGDEISGLANNLDNLNIGEISKLSRLKDLNLVRGTAAGGVIGGGGQTAYDAATGNFSVGKAVNNVLGYGAMGGAAGLANTGRMASAAKRRLLESAAAEGGLINKENVKYIGNSRFRKQFDNEGKYVGRNNPKGKATEEDFGIVSKHLDDNYKFGNIYGRQGRDSEGVLQDLKPLSTTDSKASKYSFDGQEEYKGPIFAKMQDIDVNTGVSSSAKAAVDANRESFVKTFLNMPSGKT